MPSSKLIIVINISNQNGILAYDSELDSVVESVYGNRKDHYILVRGIADYKVSGRIDLDMLLLTCLYFQDGTRRKEWQHYSALMAASVAKTIVENIPRESEEL